MIQLDDYQMLFGYLALFVAVGVGFILVHLVAGKLLRPSKPDDEKLTIYECGEPTIGSAWIQFDLRFYVVALLFVIFDVEVAFFFPWAVVYGKLNSIAQGPADDPAAFERKLLDLTPPYPEHRESRALFTKVDGEGNPIPLTPEKISHLKRDAHAFAMIAFWDILAFFGVLLVGFAYLWKRGDLDWVRSVAAETAVESDAPRFEEDLVGEGVR